MVRAVPLTDPAGAAVKTIFVATTSALIALALLVVRSVPTPSWLLAVRVKDWPSAVAV